MEGKYFFNGKDITMNICIQIRDVIDIIKRKAIYLFRMQPELFTTPRPISTAGYRKCTLGGISRIYCGPLLRRAGTKRITDNLEISLRKARIQTGLSISIILYSVSLNLSTIVSFAMLL